MLRSRLRSVCLIVLLTLFLPASLSSRSYAQEKSRTFPETGKTVSGKFLEYWNRNGGLAQQGFPISDEMQERSQTDGKTYTVQYFERAVFEHHPENQAPHDVLLSLLGAQRYLEYYGPGGASNQRVNPNNPRLFAETGRTIGGVFRAYWEQNGGLAQQGLPMSDEFQETSPLDGKTYTVQYFERAVFELHPENAGTQHEVLLTQLGTYAYRAQHSSLVLPATISPDLVRRNEQASDRYFMWTEAKVSKDDGWDRPSVTTPIVTRAFDLMAQRIITVTDTPGLEDYSAISGSIIVGIRKSTDARCVTCNIAVIAKDLSTGAAFTLADGTGNRYSPQIGGRTVAWIEEDLQTIRVVSMNIDTRGSKVHFSQSLPSDTSPSYLQLSEDYFVWSEVRARRGRLTTTLRAYSFRDGQIRQVARLAGRPATLKLSGRYLMWGDDALHLTNLDTARTTLLSEEEVNGITMRGDTLLWPARENESQAPGSSVMVGMKQSRMTPVRLFPVPRYYFQAPWIAGDWIIWKEGNAYTAVSVAQAFTNARPHTPTTPTPAAGSRLIHGNMRTTSIVGGGNSLFWLGPGAANRIYRYDLLTQSKTILYESPEQKLTLATDGRVLVWIEYSQDDRYRIRHYDLATSQVTTVIQTASSEYDYNLAMPSHDQNHPPYLAVDRGVLFYVSTDPAHKGLWARTLASGEEQLISPSGSAPVAADGKLVWLAERPDRSKAVHLRVFASSSSDTTLSEEPSYYSGQYALGGDNVLWNSSGAAGDLSRYNIPSNARTTVPIGVSGRGIILTHLLMQRNTATWTEEGVPGSGAGWSIRSFDLGTGRIQTVLTEKVFVTGWAMPNDRAIAYTKGIAIKDLYLADLP